MTTTAAAVQGFYCDLKFIKTRSVAAITIEIPIEQAAAFVAAFGTPHPSAEIPVALARMDMSAKPAKAISGPQEREPRPFASLPVAQQTGIRCEDAVFKRFIKERYHSDDPAAVVREVCRVNSRSELIKGSEAGDRWLMLESAYEVWKQI